MPTSHATPPKLPPALVAAALVACVALYWVKGGTPLLPVFGLAIMAACVLPWRLESESATWLLRLVLLLTAMFAAALGREPRMEAIVDARWMGIIGACLAAELTVQAWRRRPSLGALIGLPCLIFMLAGNTYQPRGVQFFAPAFLLCLMLGSPGYRPRAAQVRPLRLLGAVALGMTLLLGMVLCLLVTVYRMDINNWGNTLANVPEMDTVGLSLTPVLGSTFGQHGSRKRVLRVADYRGEGYLRGAAFDTYNHGRWLPEATSRRLTALPRLRGHVAAPCAHISELSPMGDLLFTTIDATGVQIDANIAYAPQDGGPVSCQLQGLRDYTVVLARAGAPPLWPTPAAERRAQLLNVPGEVDPRVRQLAAVIGAGCTTAPRKIHAVTKYLMSHHAYSLTTDPGAGDPVSNFLLQHKNAHCEYFAAAATLLLRCLHVPTRYVVGYLAHEGADDGTLVVRQRDAHAWAESWVEGAGWVTVDATPGNGRPDQAGEDRMDWLLRQWEKAQDALGGIRAWVAGLSLLQSLALAALVAAPYFLWQIWRTRRRAARAQALDYTAADPALSALAARFTAWLAHSGAPCPPHRPWLAHLATLDAPPPAAITFARAYRTARFRGAYDTAMLAELDNLLGKLERKE